MTLPLSAADMQFVQTAYAALGNGDLASAAVALGNLSVNAGRHPDAMFVASQVLIAQGRLAEARTMLQGLTSQLPMNPHAWNALGNLASEEGNPVAAAEAYARAASLDSAGLDFWLNLASAQIDAHNFDAAITALNSAERVTQADPRQWVLRGLAERGLGNNQAAIDACCKALDLEPGNVAARYNFAEALRALDEQEEALMIIGNADGLPEVTRNLRAHLLADLGRFDEAVATFKQVIARQPELADASASLAQVMPQIGRSAEALDGFRAALNARATDRELWLSAIATAKDIKQADQLIAWCTEWDSRFGVDPAVSLARGIGHALKGERTAAIDIMRGILRANPEAPGVHGHIAPLLLAEGDWDAGEHHALEASRLSPRDLSGWAWLTVAWRLKQDAREEWLADYDRLVMPVDLGMSEDEIAAVAAALHPLHKTSNHPASQSPRGGTQTPGILFDRPIPEVQKLATRLRLAINDQIAMLRADETHPFLSRLAGGISFVGSWSVRLVSAGYHANHIHQMGWLSSACYIEVPPEVAAPKAGLAVPPGVLQFGVPDETLGLDFTPRRIVQPKVGSLVLFPSYFWHGTAPFESQSPRMTVAFDALPAGF